jgi:hypothetical protein
MARAVFLGLSPAGLMSIIFLSSIERERDRQREEKVGLTVRGTTTGLGGQENHIFGLDGSQAVPASPSGRGKEYGQTLFTVYFLWR